RRVGPDGIISTIAGNGTFGFGGDGGPATQAELAIPYAVAVGPDGSVYITDTINQRIRRVGPDGIISTVAGTATAGYSGDGGPASQAEINNPTGVAVGPDGSVYFCSAKYFSEGNIRVRRVGPDGVITTAAGNGTSGFGGDGGPAPLANLSSCVGLA